MAHQHNTDTGFPATFMNDLKTYASETIDDKKMTKLCMQFASFVKKEVEEVGAAAMDVQLPIDQKTVLYECVKYIQVQLDISEIDIINLDVDTDAAAGVAANKVEVTTPGKPQLWLR